MVYEKRVGINFRFFLLFLQRSIYGKIIMTSFDIIFVRPLTERAIACVGSLHGHSYEKKHIPIRIKKKKRKKNERNIKCSFKWHK